jgi:putative FmdB family regulatory protein
MATYEWVCHKCEIFWEKDFKMGTAPERTKCPECKKLSNRLFTPTPVHFKGHGFYETDYKDKRSTTDTKNFYKSAIEMSKERMKTGWQHYGRFTLKQEKFDSMVKEGLVKKKTTEETNASKEISKRILTEAYDKAGIKDVEKYKKSKPQ